MNKWRMKMIKEDVLSWKRGFEAARETEQYLIRKEPIDSERSIRFALELIEVCRMQGIWPGSESERLRESQIKSVRERWSTLRRVLHK